MRASRFVLLGIAASVAAACVGGTAGQAAPSSPAANGRPAEPAVVFNLEQPYRVSGEPSGLRLQPCLTIDPGSEAITALGLAEIQDFDVDDWGRIFILQWHSAGDYVYAFDPPGRFVKSFVPRGLGPGKLEWGGSVRVRPGGEVLVKDPSQTKYLVYNRNGYHQYDLEVPRLLQVQHVFEDARSLVSWQNQTAAACIDNFALAKPDLGVGRLLESAPTDNPQTSPALIVGGGCFTACAAPGRVFIANAAWGYEIRVFDLEGGLLRRIRKEYVPVPISADYRRAYLSLIPDGSPSKLKYRFADHWPPFRYLFADESGRLFVMTREPGDRPLTYRYDIFDPDGLLIGQVSLGNADARIPLRAMARSGLLYALEASASGRRVLNVYRMIWE